MLLILFQLQIQKNFTDIAPIVNIQFTSAISISNVTFGNAIGLSFGWFHFAM